MKEKMIITTKITKIILTYKLNQNHWQTNGTNNYKSSKQEGFRHYRSTTNSLLNLTQYIVDGFNEEKFTQAILIDFEKAYDSVWREGLLVKLFKSGIQGKMWKWIQNFLDERLAKCLVNNTEGEWFKTNIGLPQGAVISPILFNKICLKKLFHKDASLQMTVQCGNQGII